MAELRGVPERFLSQAEVAIRVSRTARTVHRWRREHGLPCYHVGRSLLFDWAAVVGWLKAREWK